MSVLTVGSCMRMRHIKNATTALFCPEDIQIAATSLRESGTHLVRCASLCIRVSRLSHYRIFERLLYSKAKAKRPRSFPLYWLGVRTTYCPYTPAAGKKGGKKQVQRGEQALYVDLGCGTHNLSVCGITELRERTVATIIQQ